jgi:hypothetical protein
METSRTPKKMLRCTARLGVVVTVATLLFTASGGVADASSSKFCKDANSFGNLINSDIGTRAEFVQATRLAHKVANEAPASAKAGWVALAGDFSKILSHPRSANSMQKKLTSDTGRAHRAVTKVCG